MNGRRMFGVETEYAVTAIGRSGVPLARDEFVAQLLRQAEVALPSLPAFAFSGRFMQNGSRLYVDTVCHPEISSP